MILTRTASAVAPDNARTQNTLTKTTSSSSLRLSFLTLALICSTSLFQTSSAATFEPISYPSTTIIGQKLFVYGGLNNLLSPTSYSSQFATVSLKDDFKFNDIPWDFLESNISTAYAPGASNSNRDRFIVGGSKNNVGHAPAILYNIPDGEWSQAPDLPSRQDASNIMSNYHRDAPGMAFDYKNNVLVQFGGSNATYITNELTLLNIDKDTNEATWSYSGIIDSIPPLYAPIVLHIPRSMQTIIFGGCQGMNVTLEGSRPTQCTTFDTLYSLSRESIGNASTIAPIASTQKLGGNIPPPRFMPCATVLIDGNIFIMGGSGGEKLDTPMADAWILDTKTWTWSGRTIRGFSADGIMGHNCHLASRDQILVVGGQSKTGFVSNPLSVIKVDEWSWSHDFNVPDKVSTGVKVGLAISVIIVVGAIGAGLWVRNRRNKAAALKKAQGHGTKSKPTKSRRSRRPSTNQSQHQSQSQPQLNRDDHLYDLETADQNMVELKGLNYSDGEGYDQNDHKERRVHDNNNGGGDDRRQLTVDHVTGSPEGSFSSTIVGQSPTHHETEYSATWQDQDAHVNERT